MNNSEISREVPSDLEDFTTNLAQCVMEYIKFRNNSDELEKITKKMAENIEEELSKHTDKWDDIFDILRGIISTAITSYSRNNQKNKVAHLAPLYSAVTKELKPYFEKNKSKIEEIEMGIRSNRPIFDNLLTYLSIKVKVGHKINIESPKLKKR